MIQETTSLSTDTSSSVLLLHFFFCVSPAKVCGLFEAFILMVWFACFPVTPALIYDCDGRADAKKKKSTILNCCRNNRGMI